jgi:hypothetical protein
MRNRRAEYEGANRAAPGLINDSRFDPVYVGSLTGGVVWSHPGAHRTVVVTALGSLLSPLAFTATVSLVLLTLTIYETLGAESPEG